MIKEELINKAKYYYMGYINEIEHFQKIPFLFLVIIINTNLGTGKKNKYKEQKS